MVNVKGLNELISLFVGNESAPDVEDLPNIGFGYFLNISHWDLT